MSEKQAKADGGSPRDEDKPENAVKSALGMDFATLGDDARAKFQIKDAVKSGVVITRVDPSSNAAEKRIQAGEVIVEINQKPIAKPADVQDALKALKKDGKKSALLLVANASGEVRFVPVTIE